MSSQNDNIRAPDKVKRERLIEDCDWSHMPMKTPEELEIEEAIRVSNEAMDIYENEQIEKIINEIQEKKNKFKNIRFVFKRLSHFDSDIAEIYEMIEHIIDKYIVGDIEKYDWDKITYERIFKTIKNMRFNQEEMNSLKTLFCLEK